MSRARMCQVYEVVMKRAEAAAQRFAEHACPSAEHLLGSFLDGCASALRILLYGQDKAAARCGMRQLCPSAKSCDDLRAHH
jgi:hypothetical protein